MSADDDEEFVPDEEEEGSVTQGDGLMAAKARKSRGESMSQILRVVATDMDGTFLGDSGKISKRSIALVATLQEKGIVFAAATGRPSAALQPIIDQIGVPSIPAITFNGACMQYMHPHKPSTLVWEQPLSSDLARDIVHLLDSMGSCISYSTRTAAIALVKNEEQRSFLNRYEALEGVKQDRIVSTADALVTAVGGPPLKIVGLSKHPDADAKAARNALAGKPVHVIAAEMHIEFVCQANSPNSTRSTNSTGSALK